LGESDLHLDARISDECVAKHLKDMEEVHGVQTELKETMSGFEE
jgi:hypothetical protein